MTERIYTVLFDGVGFEDAARALAGMRGFVCLDTRGGSDKPSRHSIIAIEPFRTFAFSGAFVTKDLRTTIDTPQDALEQFALDVEDLPHDLYLPPAVCIGYITFEGARALRGHAPARGFSRFPQCYFGIYRESVVFDNAEGQSWVQSIAETCAQAKRQASALIEKLSRKGRLAAEDKFPPTPPPACHDETFAAAHSWLRADILTRVHIVRHSSHPAADGAGIDGLISMKKEGETLAVFSHEGALAGLFSTGRHMEINGGNVHSFHRDILEGICLSDSIKEVQKGFSGQKKPGLYPMRALAQTLPPQELAGEPFDRALEFTSMNETRHRAFHGGAFGAFDSHRIVFHSAGRTLVLADGAITESFGMNLENC